MAVIEIINSLSTGLLSDFNKVHQIEIKDTTPPKEGAFGKVYNCIQINSSRVKNQFIVKILCKKNPEENFNTVQKLQKKVSKVHKDLKDKGQSFLEVYPALEAIPQWSFEGKMDGQDVKGYCANNLFELGFIEYKTILEEDKFSVQFYKYELLKKCKICYDLVKAMELLESFKFIHADIKEDAIFINMNSESSAIIDFDSGAFYNSSTKKYNTTTKGTKGNWLAPEITNKIDNKVLKKTICPDVYSDTWSINMVLYYIFLTNDPFSFCKIVSDATIKKYLDNYKWPNIPKEETYVNKETKEQFQILIDYYMPKLPDKVKEGFEITFNQGYFKPQLRYTYLQWKEAFQTIKEKPEILDFTADVIQLTKKQDVTFNWSVKNGYKVFFDNINVSNLNTYKVKPTRDTIYSLQAYNEFDVPSKVATFKINVSKKAPEIIDFNPNSSIRMDAKPIVLKWKVKGAEKITIQPNNIEVTKLKKLEVYPLKDTIYNLEVESFFGVKNNQELKVEISKTPPNICMFKSNVSVRLDLKPVVLEWKVEHAKKITLQPGNINLIGKSSLEVTPLKDTIYLLKTESLFGINKTEKLLVEVSKKPPLFTHLSSSPEIRLDKKPILLKWETENAEKVELLPNLKKIPLTGVLEIEPRINTEYTLKATSMFGVPTEKSILVKVSEIPPDIVTFKIRRPIVKEGNKVVLKWHINGAEKVWIDGIEREEHIGTTTLIAKSTKQYNLIAETYFGIKIKKKGAIWVLKKPTLRKYNKQIKSKIKLKST